MRTSLFGLVLAAAATVVVGDDDYENYCEPESSYSPPSTPGYPSDYSPSSSSGYSSGYSSPGYPSGSSEYPSGSPGKGKGVSTSPGSSGDDYASQGGCPLGTFNTPDNRQQWGDYDINTDYNFIVPDTGVIREYWLSVEHATLAPDGVSKDMEVFNGTYPGPLLECNWGDWMYIHVTNNLKDNGTSVHWHGFIQPHNAGHDGVPGITQCPIPPGETFTYKIQATRYGPTWYHSHFTLQYGQGAVGPLMVHGPTVENWDIDLGEVLVTDYYHDSIYELWYKERVAPPVTSDNGLINGLNMFQGTGSFSEFKFTPGKRHRLTIVNTSVDAHFKFSIDGHNFTVQGADFIPIHPYEQTVLNINIGQRYDIIVDASCAVGNYWMRAVPATHCSSVNNGDWIRAVVRYEGSDDSLPTSTSWTIPDQNCVDEEGLVPWVARDVGGLAYGDQANISIVKQNYEKFTMGGTSLQIDWSNPTLLLAEKGDPSYPADYNVLQVDGTDDTWIYFVIQSVAPVALPHPLHLHGHDFLQIAKGTGVFNESVLETAQFTNPIRRDVMTLPASARGTPTGGYMVIAFPLDNPGVWVFHCHIAWHVSMGLGMQFVERISEIPGNVGVTSEWDDNCKAWNDYNTKTRPDEDDSGV